MKRKVPRKLSLVKFDFDSVPREEHINYPFRQGSTYLFLGEIPNMPGHCVLVDHNNRGGLFYVGYHTDNFIELNKEEV